MFIISSCSKDQIEIKFPVNAEVYIGDVTYNAKIYQDGISFVSDDLSEPVEFRTTEQGQVDSNYLGLTNGNSAFMLFDLLNRINTDSYDTGMYNGYCYTYEVEDCRLKNLVWGDIYVNFKYFE